MRLTGTALDCYKYLEPLYYDYRKIKRQNRSGGMTYIYMELKKNITTSSGKKENILTFFLVLKFVCRHN